jgi:hypothetical protein
MPQQQFVGITNNFHEKLKILSSCKNVKQIQQHWRKVSSGDRGTDELGTGGWSRTAGTVQVGQDVIAREDSRYSTAKKGNKRQDGQNWKSGTGQLGRRNGNGIPWKDSLDMASLTGPLRQDSKDRSTRTGQPEQVNQDR